MTAAEANRVAWFCVRSQTRREHIAAVHLRQAGVVEVFLPRIRFKCTTRRGMIWRTEALFPGYLFGRFDWREALRLARHAHGVRGIVHFGEHWPTIPDRSIEELRQMFGAAELHIIDTALAPGDAVRITGGAMRGLRAVVTRVMPGHERVAVLMEFLGRQTMIELPTSIVIREGDKRERIFAARKP